MNNRNYIKALVGCACMFALACTKKTSTTLITDTDFSNSTQVRVYLATVNASRNLIYVDGNPLNGSLLSSGGLFPASGLYGAKIPTGIKEFLVRDTLPTTTQQPLAFSQNMASGATYTIFVYDTITTPKQKTVATNIVIPADTSARLRFANFVFSRNAVPAVDVFSKRRNINLFTNVAVTDVSSFIPVPSSFNDTLFLREAGTTTQLAVLNGINLTQKRSYTVVFRGSYALTTGGTARAISVFTDY